MGEFVTTNKAQQKSKANREAWENFVCAFGLTNICTIDSDNCASTLSLASGTNANSVFPCEKTEAFSTQITKTKGHRRGCPFVLSMGYKKDVFAFSVDRVELLFICSPFYFRSLYMKMSTFFVFCRKGCGMHCM